MERNHEPNHRRRVLVKAWLMTPRNSLKMAARAATALTLCSFWAAASVASAGQTPSTHGTVPVVQAIRATSPIVVDGQLNDEVWLRTPATTGRLGLPIGTARYTSCCGR